MDHVYLFLYRPFLGDKKVVDNLIGTYNYLRHPSLLWNKKMRKLHCTHSEICFPGRETPYGKMFTSTMGQAGGKNRKGSGVVGRSADKVLIHPERWFYIKIPLPAVRVTGMLSWCVRQHFCNKGYDKKAILDLLGLGGWHDGDKFVCSEFCQHALSVGLYNAGPEHWKISTKYVMDPLTLALTVVTESGLPVYDFKTKERIL